MKRPIFFCKSWFRAKKRPTEVWTEAQARAASARGTLFTVLVDSVERPWCFLECNGPFVGVGFLDGRLRESTYYAFSRQGPDGPLFLTDATHREFEGDSDAVREGTTYVFQPDGTVRIRRQCFSPPSLETKETTADVSGNYAPWPEFGEYDDLVRVERSV
jgi:hypothetical protein